MLGRTWSSKNSHFLRWECKVIQALCKTAWQFLTKVNRVLLYNPALVLLGIYPNELKIHVHTKTCTPMFLSAFSWLPNRQMDKEITHPHTECYSAIKLNELPSHEKIQGKFKCILLSERSQSEKMTYIPYDSNYRTFWKRQNYRNSKDQWLQRFRGEREGWMDRAEGSFRAVKLLYDTIMVGILHYALSKLRTVRHKVNRNVNCGF